MNTKRFFIFSVLIALLSMAGGLFPANAKASAIIKAATPTPRSALKTAVFDLKSANKVSPEDIINQIAFSGMGGGSELCKSGSYPAPVIVEKSIANIELMENAYMAVCGWTKNEKLTGSLTFPNGQTQVVNVQTATSNGNYVGTMNFEPKITDPTGKYTLTMSGKTGSVQLVVNFIMPKGPHIYTLDKYHILLYGLLPSESLKLFYYANSGGTLKGWDEYTTGADGRLEVKTSMNVEYDGIFIAIGDKTGEIHMQGTGMTNSTIKTAKALCPNGIPSRVKVGDVIRAAFTDGTNLRIRNDIGFDKPEQYKVKEGTKMTVIGGPKCTSDGTTWWKIKVSEDVKGWVAEYWHGDEYLIEPAP